MGHLDMAKIQPEHALVRLERRELLTCSEEAFDRLAFALRAVRLLKPPEMTVAVYEGRFEVRASSGRDYSRGQSATWGMLCVPPHASRLDIAMAVLRLAGKSEEPYLLDLLLAPSPHPYRT